LSAEEVSSVAGFLTKARRAYSNKSEPVINLTALADEYIALEDETMLLGPPQTFTVALNPRAEAAHMISGLTNTMRGLGIQT
jgi:hypothetical protein